MVTVQLPVYNEKYVVGRLIDGVVRLRYPLERLEIQVLDDSTDETVQLAAAKVREHQARGYRITHLRRAAREGFKAGALREGLSQAKGEFVAVFDADYVPVPDFLLRTLPYFDDPRVGMVQTRWEHSNRERSLLTRVLAFMLDAHLTIEQVGRSRQGCFFSFNGTAGVWRAETIRDAGNWQGRTLTEDLDLSFRAQLRGWRFLYLDEIMSTADLPEDIRSFRSQQFRWMKGVAENASLLFPRILGSQLPPRVKLHACYQLLQTSLYLPALALVILTFPFVAVEYSHLGLAGIVLNAIFMAGGIGLALVYVPPQRERLTGISGALEFLSLWFSFSMVTAGLAVHNGLAALSGLLGYRSEFVRTPKGLPQPGVTSPPANVYLPRGMDHTAALEVLVWVYLAAGLLWGFSRGEFAFHYLPAMAFAGLSYLLAKSVKYALVQESVARRLPAASKSSASPAEAPKNISSLQPEA